MKKIIVMLSSAIGLFITFGFIMIRHSIRAIGNESDWYGYPCIFFANNKDNHLTTDIYPISILIVILPALVGSFFQVFYLDKCTNVRGSILGLAP